MEKKEISILIAIILGIFVISFYGEFTGDITGNLVNERIINGGLVECNIADFNGDGIVNYVDKEDFGEDYSLSPLSSGDCSLLDFNSDGEITILDANVYNELYDENYGVQTGRCFLRKLVCEEAELKLSSEFDLGVKRQAELFEEKPGFFKKIKNFFKYLF
jgi:hypothetical protein